ncbi:outer membrane beta-barrel protein [Pedobacter sp. SYP-B3415]|uniref:outer membrane beta-barrel protein n=1 Tax=Pedobacter sp. SYP-B3415 TaxID=2496641 RepID=UPI00101CBE35|nr:outer membrane beta-barrel protein [Pedobacter sp. SYP-B3415]
MKKLLLSLVAVAGLAYGANAQTEQGKIILGGNVGFNSTKAEGAPKSNVSFQVVPSVGYFIDNNFAIGTGVGYTYSKEIAETEDQAFVVAPFARYYTDLSGQFKFFGQLSVPMAFGSSKDVNAAGDVGAKLGTTTNIGVALSPGFAFFPTSRVGIEFSVRGLSWENEKLKAEGSGAEFTTNSFDVNGNFFAPRLGVQFHF